MDSDRYFTAAVIYIHRNAQKHGLVGDFRQWPYTSYRIVLSNKPTHLQRSDVLAWFDGQAGFELLHRSPFDEAAIGPLIVDDIV